MNVDVPCPQCGTIFTVRRELLGRRTKCTRCGAAFTISVPDDAPGATGAAGRVPSPPPPPAANYFPEISPPPEIAPIPQINPEPKTQSARRPSQPTDYFGFASDASQPRFTALKLIARGYEILAAIVVAIAAIGVLILFVSMIVNPNAILKNLVEAGMAVVWSGVAAVSLLACAQIIRLALQVEHNTRQTHQACRQLANHLCAIESDQ